MDNKKLNKISFTNLIVAYLMCTAFIATILLCLPPKLLVKEVVFNSPKINKTKTERVIEYIDRNDTIVLNNETLKNHNNFNDIIIEEDLPSGIHLDKNTVVNFRPIKSNINSINYESRTFSNDVLERSLDNHVGNDVHRGRSGLSFNHGRNHGAPRLNDKNSISFDEAMARRKIKQDESASSNDSKFKKDKLNFSKLTPINKGGDLSEDFLDFNLYPAISKDPDRELYAYNYPSKGVGAGIGSGSLGASAGQAAGIGAGIGEGLLNGEAVPTLGGIGDGAKTSFGEPVEASGVGGLIGGAGAGGAAGLTQGYITEKLGIKTDLKRGAGIERGEGHEINYKHLPENGSLHIMMHVDGSGSILKTRKKLEIMKDTLLKKALLPYYKNDESLYNKRVTIVDGSGERTLKFFNKATEKDNVLAIVFQDEAQPDYHLPNFNRRPESHYKEDLNKLKSNLNERKGIYRGIMFQVGEKNFSRSFKEFLENAWQGKGYLKSDNLKKYYWQGNKSNINKKEGVVFSDEYHTKTEGDPSYYMDLIFKASEKIGIDLKSYGSGLKDGIFIRK